LDGYWLGALINNAGIVCAGPLLFQPMEQVEAQIAINLLAPLALVRAFAPFLGTDPAQAGRRGGIINVSSSAGKVSSPTRGGYAISKHGLAGSIRCPSFGPVRLPMKPKAGSKPDS